MITILEPPNPTDQLARSEEVLLFSQMAGPCTPHSFRYNPPLGEEDELAGGLSRAPIKDSNTPTPSLIVFWAQTLALAPAPAPALPFNEWLFQQFMKA